MSMPMRSLALRSRASLTTLLMVVAMLALTATPASAGRSAPPSSPPALAADAVLYSGYHGGVQQVYSMKPDGTAKTQLTFNKTGDKKCDPVASPSGTEIAYASNDGGMYVHRLGGAAENLAPDPEPGMLYGGGRRPAWSPDGNTIVFGYSTNRNAGQTPDAEAIFDLFMVSREGATWGEPRRITNVAKGAAAMHPRYRGGLDAGSWLSYSYRGPSSAVHDLHVMHAPKGVITPTTTSTPGYLLIEDAGTLSSWNTTGTKVAFVKSSDGGVYVANASPGSGAPALTEPAPVLVASSGCGLSFSRSIEALLIYATDCSRINKLTIGSAAAPVQIGIGTHPSA